MISSLLVRSYRPEDREALRRLCCDTADAGGPVEPLFFDREIFADFWTAYYTDHEPESTWVVEEDGRLAGYLTGCLDGKIFFRSMAFFVVPRILWRGLREGRLINKEALLFFKTQWAMERKEDDGRRLPPDYPGHFHINLSGEARGRGGGRQLVETFLSHARNKGARGVHAGVREDNLRARRFFEKMGFEVLAKRSGFRRMTPPHRDHAVVVYGKKTEGFSAN